MKVIDAFLKTTGSLPVDVESVVAIRLENGVELECEVIGTDEMSYSVSLIRVSLISNSKMRLWLMKVAHAANGTVARICSSNRAEADRLTDEAAQEEAAPYCEMQAEPHSQSSYETPS